MFGHRLWPRQNPWLLLLEFLNVAEAQQREPGGLLAAQEPTRPQPYALSYRMGLRNVLFNNDEVAEVAALPYDDETLWTLWIKSMVGAEAAPAGDSTILRAASVGSATSRILWPSFARRPWKAKTIAAGPRGSSSPLALRRSTVTLSSPAATLGETTSTSAARARSST